MTSTNQTPGGYKFGALVVDQLLWRENQPDCACFGLSSPLCLSRHVRAYFCMPSYTTRCLCIAHYIVTISSNTTTTCIYRYLNTTTYSVLQLFASYPRRGGRRNTLCQLSLLMMPEGSGIKKARDFGARNFSLWLGGCSEGLDALLVQIFVEQ